MTSRNAFEEWVLSTGGTIGFSNKWHTYTDPTVQRDWRAWLAAFKACDKFMYHQPGCVMAHRPESDDACTCGLDEFRRTDI